MKNLNKRKSILEQGGLMIEALAMLGLIAVVTPTMYKKSAERTMEVEDINTSTTIRTLMNAAESFVKANYINLMNGPLAYAEGEDETAPKTYDVTLEDDPDTSDANENALAPYLPYKFETTSSLYNYKKPKLTLVRVGDSISAFMLFPAKGDESEGIGQERTVRIASLVGSNGGYVTKEGGKNEAHGVGGVWNLRNDGTNTEYETVFSGDDSNQYSIVTASSNVVNSSTADSQMDNDKYLQRTKENDLEVWRNSMRTDLYLGGTSSNLNQESIADAETQEKYYSIQNINRLIIGGHDTDNEFNDNPINISSEVQLSTDKDITNYGLYIHGSGVDGSKAGNAFIKGSIEAAQNKFFVDETDMEYFGPHMLFDGVRFELGKAEDGMYAIKGDVEGKKQVNVFDTTVAIDAGTADGRKIDILGDSGNKTVQIHEAKDAGTFNNGQALVAVTTGDTTAPDDGKLTPDKYTNVPDFGVDVDGNMVVQGILAAGQLDVNKIRANKLSVGSQHIDDAYKWMDVDDTGVHIHEPNSSYNAAKPGTQVEVKTNLVALRAGDAANVTDKAVSDHPSQIVLSEDGIVEKVQDGKLLAISSDEVGVNIKDNDIKFGNVDNDGKRDSSEDQYLAEFGEGANVDIKKGNLKVSDGSKPIFTVRGNDSEDKSVIKDTPMAGNEKYQVAAHGNTVISDTGDNVRYLAMGPADTDAAVNIIKGDATSTTQNARGVLTIDLDSKAVPAYTKHESGGDSDYTTEDTARTLDGGSIYIRRGLIDIAPDASYSENAGEAGLQAWTADNGRGVIRASRFVANNITKDGNRVMVPEMFDSAYYAKFNGEHGANRYDTYMVNPAYTSVMNDIKLVSRSGARLSDILPNFITKGMFVATNTWTEDMVSGTNPEDFTLSCTGTTTGCTLAQYNDALESREDNAFRPASPVIGTVPAPQCPPGYQKVIQVTPARISMAQAGSLRANGYGVAKTSGGESVDVTDFNNITYSNSSASQVPSGAHSNDGVYAQAEKIKSAFNDFAYANPKYQRQFTMGGDNCKQMKTVTDPETGETLNYCAEYDTYDDLSMKLVDTDETGSTDVRYNSANKLEGVKVSYEDYAMYNYGNVTSQPRQTAKTDDIKLGGKSLVSEVEKFSLRNADGGVRYILTSSGNALEPVTFQKNTNLYTQAVPLKSSDDFGRAWTLLMGFIYPSHSYSSILSTGSLKSGDGYLWNVFPVDYNSLEAYVTTYCYWDSFNIKEHVTDTDNLPMVNTLDFYPISQEPVGSGQGGDLEFRQKLNDPSMKYNELW